MNRILSFCTPNSSEEKWLSDTLNFIIPPFLGEANISTVSYGFSHMPFKEGNRHTDVERPSACEPGLWENHSRVTE